MHKSVFVTGADGFIGSHLTNRLVSAGFKTKALVQYNSTGSIGWLSDLPKSVLTETEIILGDVRDPEQMIRAMSNVELVFHLAALIAIPYSYEAPRSYVDTNIVGTMNILEAARHQSAKVIHTSTSEVYGTAIRVPIDEQHPLQGQSPYSASKISADQMAYAYHSSYGLDVTIVRPFNTYGPRQSLRAVIPAIINQLINGQKEIKLGLLSPTRDFNYIDDTVEGFMAAANSNHGSGETINIGSGFEISIEETARMIASILDVDITICSDEKRLRPKNSEVFRLCADNTKAKKLIGWTPNHSGISGFKSGLTNTIEWFSEPANLEKYINSVGIS